MHKILLTLAYGWLTLAGVMHFFIDVVSQHVRGLRPPSPETTLYDGLHTSFALGQVLVGVIGLWLAWRARELLAAPPMVVLSLMAATSWFTIAALFIEYWQPRFSIGVFAALVVAAAVAGRHPG